jgi:hypothetical protein
MASKGIPVTKTITVAYSAGSGLTVDPPLAFLLINDPIEWSVASIPSGDSLEIDFSVIGSLKGPFPRNAKDPDNPVRGRWMVRKARKFVTLPADHPGLFKYSLVVRAGGKDVAVLDPMIVIKK